MSQWPELNRPRLGQQPTPLDGCTLLASAALVGLIGFAIYAAAVLLWAYRDLVVLMAGVALILQILGVAWNRATRRRKP